MCPLLGGQVVLEMSSSPCVSIEDAALASLIELEQQSIVILQHQIDVVNSDADTAEQRAAHFEKELNRFRSHSKHLRPHNLQRFEYNVLIDTSDASAVPIESQQLSSAAEDASDEVLVHSLQQAHADASKLVLQRTVQLNKLQAKLSGQHIDPPEATVVLPNGGCEHLNTH